MIEPSARLQGIFEHSIQLAKGLSHEYITIEHSVRPKDKVNYHACPIHANERLLVVCYKEDWKQLKYVKSRKSRYEEEQDCLEVVGEGAWRESK